MALVNVLARNNASRKAGLVVKGCNGWYHPTERVVLHSGTRCPVCDGPVAR